MVNCWGLLTSQEEPVPLKSVEVELEVRAHVATVVSTLNYENKEDKPLEAVFVFPLPGDAAVCHFSAKYWTAREEYDDALSSGQQAFLLEESDQSPDLFSLSVGSLRPGESASIRLEYVTELAVQADEGLRFCLPAVLNPRYQPRGSKDVCFQVTSVPASLVPYSLSFSARQDISLYFILMSVFCELQVKMAAGHKFDRDVELLIYYKDAHQPTAVVEAGRASAKPGTLMGDPVVMLSLYPEFPQAVMSAEFVFLLDRSGSMAGSRIRDTLLLLLKSLPMGCYFNIYSFGKSVEYNETTMKEALKEVNMMGGDLGGTEILIPLEHIYIHTHRLKKNLENSGSHRCFSFGIGKGASSALINGLAKEGGGHFLQTVFTHQVMQSLRFALQPAVVDIAVKWDLPKGVSVTALSPPITSFHGQRSLVYAQLTEQSSEAVEGCVMVKYSLAGHPSQNQVHFRLLIRSLEMKEGERGGEQNGEVKKKVVELSVQSGVSSAFTAFIAVNKGDGKVIQGPLVLRNVPTPSEYIFPREKFKGKKPVQSCSCCVLFYVHSEPGGVLKKKLEWDLNITLDEELRLIQFQIMHRFYWTPSRLFKLGLKDTPNGWKCKTEDGLLLHVLWSFTVTRSRNFGLGSMSDCRDQGSIQPNIIILAFENMSSKWFAQLDIYTGNMGRVFWLSGGLLKQCARERRVRCAYGVVIYTYVYLVYSLLSMLLSVVYLEYCGFCVIFSWFLCGWVVMTSVCVCLFMCVCVCVCVWGVHLMNCMFCVFK
uniref:VIT domain-containing protein n=1 Tax=Sander lucioperca TaxID=283035 RepID=A0A8C9YAL9_SANLU